MKTNVLRDLNLDYKVVDTNSIINAFSDIENGLKNIDTTSVAVLQNYSRYLKQIISFFGGIVNNPDPNVIAFADITQTCIDVDKQNTLMFACNPFFYTNQQTPIKWEN